MVKAMIKDKNYMMCVHYFKDRKNMNKNTKI